METTRKQLLVDISAGKTGELLGTILVDKVKREGHALLVVAMMCRVDSLARKNHGRALTGVRIGDFVGGARVLFRVSDEHRLANPQTRVVEIISSDYDRNVLWNGGEIEPADMQSESYGIPAEQLTNAALDPHNILPTVGYRKLRRENHAGPLTVAAAMTLKQAMSRGPLNVQPCISALCGAQGWAGPGLKVLSSQVMYELGLAQKEIARAAQEAELSA